MSGKTKILALLLLGLGMIFLVLAFLSGQSAKTSGESIKQEIERVPVVVSTREIPFGTTITADMLKVEKFALAPAGGYKDINEALGKKPLFNIGSGLPVTAQYFESGAVAAEVREGFRAFAMRLDDNNMATAKIKAGDFIDVFSLFRINNQEVGRTVSRMVLPKLRVLSVGSQLVNTPETASSKEELNDSNGNRRTQQLRAVTVEVPVQDVNTLALAQSQGELFAVIRNPNDEELPDPAKYPVADTVLKPVKPKAEKGQPMPVAPALSELDKAYAGMSLANTVEPGSANNNKDKRNAVNAGAPAAAGDSAPSTVEVIRGGEISREKAR